MQVRTPRRRWWKRATVAAPFLEQFGQDGANRTENGHDGARRCILDKNTNDAPDVGVRNAKRRTHCDNRVLCICSD